MKKIVKVTRYACESCGKTVQLENKYCSHCGYDLSKETIYQEAPTKRGENFGV